MITANLCGNFGNNLASYLICRTIAERKGFEWGVNPHPTHDYHNGMNQMYFMDVDFGKQTIDGILHTFEEKWTMIDRNETINIATFDKRVYDIEDNTRLMGYKGAWGGLWQSEDYYIDRKEDIKQWLKIKPEYVEQYEAKLKELNIFLDDNTCVINFRGGEYKGIPVILKKEYWSYAIKHMQAINPKMKFVCISDDVECAKTFMPFEIPTFHIEIGFDFYAVNQAKWLIISNSSFGMWAAWLNDKVKMTIAPKYWSQWNYSDGYWGLGDQWYRSFRYMDRDGNLSDCETVKQEAIAYYKAHNLLPELYS